MNYTDEENEVLDNASEATEEKEVAEEVASKTEETVAEEEQEVKLDDFVDLEKKQLRISLKTFIYFFAIILLIGALFLLVCLIEKCLTGIISFYETPNSSYVETKVDSTPAEKEGVILQYHDEENVLIIDEYIGSEVRE